MHSLVVESLNTGVILVDADYNLVYFNHFMQSHPALKSPDILGKNLFSVFPELPKSWMTRKLQSVVMLDSPAFSSWEQRQYLFKMQHTRPITTSNEFMAQNISMLPIKSDKTKNEVDHICITVEDATDVCFYQEKLKLTLAELERSNRTDGLTQIANRRYWEERFNTAFLSAVRYNEELSLILFDLDKFKIINDKFGHQAGDKVLIESAALIQSMLRQHDVFGRYGGEEFAILLPNTGLRGAYELAERIRVAFENQIVEYKSFNIAATLSLGVVSYHSGIRNYDDMLTRADMALYESKRSGRNKTTVYQAS
ncbi:diguanylate cyclase [Catenovulum sp. 2E275]|uniref:sensor domain-containing diguanylate cyclase n=1 Tax=Catenovulum sp. 2E275 TaxID=2980497 RepID=UPI0021D34AF4|nr:diguanylate cyclase [Catenovulum sp. 2E275]MCU4674964.1 diguanylate cyclase [Catenovulum sp. 2E275]